MISVAKRDRNKKRPYLIVNPLQGKHMPIDPSVAIHLFGQLAEKINAQILGQNTVVISFAETATAIGACAALSLIHIWFFCRGDSTVPTHFSFGS